MNKAPRNVLRVSVVPLLLFCVSIVHHLSTVPSTGPDAALAMRTQEPVPIAACIDDRFSSCTILDSKVEGRTRTRLVYLPDFTYPNIVVEDTLAPVDASGETRLIEQKAMVADHILVALNKNSSPQALKELCSQAGATVRRQLRSGKRQLYVVGLAKPSLEAVKSALACFSNHADVVAYAEPDGLIFSTGIPNDPNFAAQYNMHNTGQNSGTVDADIDAPEAWNIATGSRNVLVGIVDSGIDINHPDLKANIWTNPGEIPNNGIDDDNNGYVDDVHGWNFMNDNNDVLDVWLHGTHVAGIVGAEGGNGKYVAGVCHKVSMVSIKAIDFFRNGGAGVTSAAVEGIYYGTSVGVSVTNNSYGGQEYSTAM
jgi:large repetitive protein